MFIIFLLTVNNAASFVQLSELFVMLVLQCSRSTLWVKKHPLTLFAQRWIGFSNLIFQNLT